MAADEEKVSKDVFELFQDTVSEFKTEMKNGFLRLEGKIDAIKETQIKQDSEINTIKDNAKESKLDRRWLVGIIISIVTLAIALGVMLIKIFSISNAQ